MAERAGAWPDFSPFPDERIPLAVMSQSWNRLTFLHWRYERAIVQRLLPRGLEVDAYDGAAWVALTPFVARVRPPHAPPLLSLSFPETNVRTYVRGPRGKRGVWFFSLDAARISAVLAARYLYHLPYMWSRMRVSEQPREIRYQSRRRWPKAAVESDIIIEPGAPFAPVELGDLDHFLTARWRLYTVARSGFALAKVEHPPWPLMRARVLRLDENLISAAGLPAPEGEPLVHYSLGVDVRVGPLAPV